MIHSTGIGLSGLLPTVHSAVPEAGAGCVQACPILLQYDTSHYGTENDNAMLRWQDNVKYFLGFGYI